MSEMALQLKTRIQNVNILNNNIAFPKLILNSMLITLGGLGILYMIILSNTVFNIVERKSLEKEELTLTNQVGDLELSYLAVSNSVDLALSAKMGFNEVKNPAFATRKALSNVKITNNEI